jgi:hypothetical protein
VISEASADLERGSPAPGGWGPGQRALGQPVRLSGGGAASSHFESYADAAVKSNACALPSGAGFQTARERSTIEP